MNYAMNTYVHDEIISVRLIVGDIEEYELIAKLLDICIAELEDRVSSCPSYHNNEDTKQVALAI